MYICTIRRGNRSWSPIGTNMQHCHFLFHVDGLQKFANARLRNHVEADGWLIQVEQFRVMQEGCRQVAAHTLAERELAHGRIDELIEREHGAQTLQVSRVSLFGIVSPRNLSRQEGGAATCKCQDLLTLL